MAPTSSWAATAASLPQAARAQREGPFWQGLATRLGWRRVADAGCGAGFHLGLLRALGVDAVGFDLALDSVAASRVRPVIVGDIARPPLRGGVFDAALCLGNTLSLLPDRAAQREVLAALGALVRPGGVVLLQGEDAGLIVRDGPVARTRRIDAASVHVRVFARAGRRVRMLAGVVRDDADTSLHGTWLLPTSRAFLRRMAAEIGLAPVSLPDSPPGGGVAWWLAVSARSSES